MHSKTIAMVYKYCVIFLTCQSVMFNSNENSKKSHQVFADGLILLLVSSLLISFLGVSLVEGVKLTFVLLF